MSADRRQVRAAARREAAIIGADALLILCALDDHDDGITGEVYVGIPTLARLSGYGLDRVRARLADMVDAGVLCDTGKRVRNVTVYRLPWGADLTPENVANPGPPLDHPSTTPRPPLDHPSGTPRVPSTNTQGVGALEGEGEGEGEVASHERCTNTNCPNGGDFTGTHPCHGCKTAKQRQQQRDTEVAAARQAARRTALLQDHQFADDGSGITCAGCGLPHQRHPQPAATLAPVGAVAEAVTA